MDICKQVGQNIRKLRDAKGWSQEDFADKIGIHRTYISGIERGVRNPTIRVLDKIAKTLETKLENLVTRSKDH